MVDLLSFVLFLGAFSGVSPSPFPAFGLVSVYSILGLLSFPVQLLFLVMLF